MEKEGFSSHLASDEITTRGYKALTFAKCTTIMTAMLMDMIWLGMELFWSSLCGAV
jgi:hypothetical protein